MIMHQTTRGLAFRRLWLRPSCRLQTTDRYGLIYSAQKKDRRELPTPFGPEDGLRPRVRAGPQCAIPFRRQDSLPMDHTTPFSSRKGTSFVLRPSVGPPELARGREASR